MLLTVPLKSTFALVVPTVRSAPSVTLSLKVTAPTEVIVPPFSSVVPPALVVRLPTFSEASRRVSPVLFNVTASSA